MIVQVSIKNVYGRDTIYPVNETARLFADIAGTKTLRPEDVEKIKALGYTVVAAAEITQL